MTVFGPLHPDPHCAPLVAKAQQRRQTHLAIRHKFHCTRQELDKVYLAQCRLLAEQEVAESEGLDPLHPEILRSLNETFPGVCFQPLPAQDAVAYGPLLFYVEVGELVLRDDHYCIRVGPEGWREAARRLRNFPDQQRTAHLDVLLYWPGA